MADLYRALTVLKEIAYLLDNHVALSAPRRYERITNDYQDALVNAYRTWVRVVLSGLTGDVAGQKSIIQDAANNLVKMLTRVGTEHLPYAVTAIGVKDYVPSPAAWRMIADAIESQNRDIETRLVPEITEKLQRAIDEGTDIAAVAESLVPRVAFYAGNLWVVIQRLVGDFARQVAERDDIIYRCRWVRVKDEKSCEACKAFEGEYDSYDAMLRATHQCVPGYFVNSPYPSCWWNCRCWIELKVDGVWRRI